MRSPVAAGGAWARLEVCGSAGLVAVQVSQASTACEEEVCAGELAGLSEECVTFPAGSGTQTILLVYRRSGVFDFPFRLSLLPP